MTDRTTPLRARGLRRLGAIALALGVAAGAAQVVGSSPVAAADASADLSVSIGHAPGAPKTGETATFTVVISNAGPAAAADVVVGLNVGYQLRYAPITGPSAPNCRSVQDNSSVICRVGTVAPNTSATLSIPVVATYAGVITVPVAVSSITPDPDTTDRSATDIVIIDQGPTAVEGAVADIYRTILGRDATAAELAHWSLAWSQSSYDRVPRIPLAIISSSESRQRRVRASFTRILGRSPRAAELAHWSGLMGRGLTIEALEVRLATSAEALASRPTFDQQLQGVYRVVLGRSASSREVATWSARRASGLRLGQIGMLLTTTTEARDRVLRDRHRLAKLTPGDFTRFLWFSALNEGSTSDREWARMLTGPEYLNRFNPFPQGYPVF